jgi:hypothetical protein
LVWEGRCVLNHGQFMMGVLAQQPQHGMRSSQMLSPPPYPLTQHCEGVTHCAHIGKVTHRCSSLAAAVHHGNSHHGRSRDHVFSHGSTNPSKGATCPHTGVACKHRPCPARSCGDSRGRNGVLSTSHHDAIDNAQQGLGHLTTATKGQRAGGRAHSANRAMGPDATCE